MCNRPNGRIIYSLNHLFGDNYAICEQIRTKFDTETETEVLDQVLPGKLISQKITDGLRWWQCHTEIQIISHNWAITAYCTVRS